MNKNKPDYRNRGFEKIPAANAKKAKDPASAKKTAKRDLRVKGG